MQMSDASWFALLSIVLAVEGGFIGLNLRAQLGAGVGWRRRLLLAGAAFALAAAIWSLHFIALLNASAVPATRYRLLPTLLSFLLGVLVAGGAISAASIRPLSPARLALASILLAAAMVVIHAIGMATLDHSAGNPLYGVGGGVIALAGSALTFWLAARRPGPPLPAAVVFGLTVAAVHYGTMAGTTLVPPSAMSVPAISAGSLMIVVVVVAFCLTGLFLLLLMPDQLPSVPEAAKIAPIGASNSACEPPAPVMSTSLHSGDATLRRGIYAPLGGAGAPPPRLADHLPVERDGTTQFVPVEDVIAVQANAHYTFLFNGSAKLFCPLAIGEVESRLDRTRFMRVHRSHIINIERVTGYRRSGDSEIVELAGVGHVVPVSRSRAGWLKTHIGAKNGSTETDERDDAPK